MSRLQHKRGRKSNYAHSLNSEYWKEVRQKILARDRKCVKCGSVLFLEVHHKTYIHKGDELEYLEDLILLCSNCHQKEHN
jgi:5-methylcytosine-specific restriction endonuclease McrA